MIPESIAHYRILEKLGAGGMGEVYLALDTKLDRKVAIKVVRPDSVADANLNRRLLREAQAAAKLDHPNICAVYDVNQTDSRTYIVMQYIEGETLATRMKRAPIDPSTALAMATQVTEGLAEAHAHGVVHRDIKPQNIVITPRGQLKILDFGLAKQMESTDADAAAATVSLLSTPGHVIGTVPYMSPEQVKGEPLDASSDIFSLGVIVFEMLAGQHPFKDQSSAVTMSRILLYSPIPTEPFHSRVPPQVQAVVSKMLCKDKAGRYHSAQDLLPDIRPLSGTSWAPATRTDPTPDVPPAVVAPPVQPPLAMPRGGRRVMWVLAAALALVPSVVGVRLWLSPERLDSLAILPFMYASSDPQLMANPDREYLSDGLTESIINNLSQLRGLKVIARNSTFRYKGKDLDVQTIGRELNVGAALVGQVKQERDGLRINVELINVRDNRSIWGDTYQRRQVEVQAVEHDIARNVSRTLGLTLSGADQTQLARSATASGEAYEAYLKGRHYWNKRTDDGFKQAIGFFQEAIAKDPKYALAYTGLADGYILRSDFGFMDPKEGYALAKGAVTLALEYDDSLAEAHTSLASIKAVTDWDWQGAEKEYRRAIELNPNYATAHHWYALQLMLQGRLDQARLEIQKAQQLDPRSLAISKDFAVILLYSRNYDKALEQCRKTLEIEPTFATMAIYIAQIDELRQNFPKAVAGLERARAAAPDDVEIAYALAQAYALIGRKDDALRLATELDGPATRGFYLPVEAAYLQALLGDKDRAVATLQTAADGHHFTVAEVKMDPRLAELRKDARVVKLLQQIGLAQ